MVTDFYQLTPAQQAESYQELARQALSRCWGLDKVDLSVIKIRENAVFKVETSDGLKHALRIHRAAYHSDDELRSELQWMQALENQGIQVPQLIPALDGQLFVSETTRDIGELRQIDLFDWVKGEQLGSVEEGVGDDIESLRNTFRTIGELAGRVHIQSSSWKIPTGFVRHAWDLEGLTGENPFWGRFWELEALSSEQRSLMTRVRGVLQQELGAYEKSSHSYGIIHADMVPENVMVDGGQVRLIDFDDAGFGWYLFELATSLYFNLGEAFFDEIQDELIQGYRSARSLSEEELEKLPLFLLARSTTYLGWVHTRKETETAQELTPVLIEMACKVADDYLSR